MSFQSVLNMLFNVIIEHVEKCFLVLALPEEQHNIFQYRAHQEMENEQVNTTAMRQTY